MERLTVGSLGSDHLLWRGGQLTVGLRRSAHPLYGAHHIGLLSQEGISQVVGPANILIQFRQDIRKGDQGLHTGIPILLLERQRSGRRLSGSCWFGATAALPQFPADKWKPPGLAKAMDPGRGQSARSGYPTAAATRLACRAAARQLVAGSCAGGPCAPVRTPAPATIMATPIAKDRKNDMRKFICAPPPPTSVHLFRCGAGRFGVTPHRLAGAVTFGRRLHLSD